MAQRNGAIPTSILSDRSRPHNAVLPLNATSTQSRWVCDGCSHKDARKRMIVKDS